MSSSPQGSPGTSLGKRTISTRSMTQISNQKESPATKRHKHNASPAPLRSAPRSPSVRNVKIKAAPSLTGSFKERRVLRGGLLNSTSRNTRSSGKVFRAHQEVKGSMPRELALLTEWSDWMYDVANKSAKAAKEQRNHTYEKTLEEEAEQKAIVAAEKERKRKEEELVRKEEERKRKEEERIRKEEERLERARLKKEQEKIKAQKRKERELEIAKKRNAQLSKMARESESPEAEDVDDIVVQRTVKEESVLVDGYLPFLQGWRSDQEIPIRDRFFIEEVYNDTTSEVTQTQFITAKAVINNTVGKSHPRKYKEYKNFEPRDLMFPTPVFPFVEELYYLLESQDFYLDPLEEIGRLMELISFCYLPEEHKLKLYNPNAPYESMVGRYSKCYFGKDFDGCLKVIDEFKELLTTLQKSGEINRYLQQKKTFSRMCLHELLNQVYSRAVSPKVHTLKSYKAFSNEVYGELLPKFISQVFDQCGVHSGHKFIDLGSGVGNVTIQAALEYGCESYGVEIMKNCSELAERQEVAFDDRSRLFGIAPGAVKLFGNQSFVGNPEVLDVINDCDIILVNNFLFTPDLNKQTLQLFLDLKPGTRIISLKKVIPEARYHDFDDDFLSKFLVEKHQFGSGCVSWTDAGGVYYITTYTGQVSDERKVQLRKLHNTRRKENEFLKRSASVNFSSTSSAASTSPPASSYITSEVSDLNSEVKREESLKDEEMTDYTEISKRPLKVGETVSPLVSTRENSTDSKSYESTGTSENTSVETVTDATVLSGKACDPADT